MLGKNGAKPEQQHTSGYDEVHDEQDSQPSRRRSDVGKDYNVFDEVIARWLRTKVDVLDPHVQQPDSEHHGGENLHPDEDFHAEVCPVSLRSDESSLAYVLLRVNVSKMMVQWTQSIPYP